MMTIERLRKLLEKTEIAAAYIEDVNDDFFADDILEKLNKLQKLLTKNLAFYELNALDELSKKESK